MDPFIGEIRLLPYSFTDIQDWLLCNGQTVSILQYQALYAVIGLTYGGDGKTNFKLPDLRNCIPVGAGTGPGLTPRSLGQAPFGASKVQLGAENFAPHSHSVQGRAKATIPANRASAPSANAMLSAPLSARNTIQPTGPLTMSYAPQTIAPAGKALPSARNNEQPFLMLNFYICTDGVFPMSDD